MSKKQQERHDEEKRLKETKEYIKKTLEATEIYRSEYKANIQEAMENLDYLDSSQSYISVLINTKFMEMAEKNFDQLNRVKNNPYFARVDFIPEGGEKDRVYIGKTSLMRAEDEIPLIVDWRSPIANVYYEGRIGEVSYRSHEGNEAGELTLKRQYTIEDGELKAYMDIDIATTDDFLQASLDAKADEKLKDIAATIQSEQNRIIRADLKNPLIVQGAAGSGKTTIALHRIAYFIYTYEETFDPDHFMIIAPNNLFLDYISNVLPELGVNEVRQTTYVDLMKSLIGKKLKLTGTGDKLKQFVGKDYPKNLPWLMKYKGSLSLYKGLNEYLDKMEEEYLTGEDCTLLGEMVLDKETIKELILIDFTHLPLYKRSKELKKSLRNQYKKRKKDIQETIAMKYDEKIENLRVKIEDLEERRLKTLPLMEQRDKALKKLEKEGKNLVNNYAKGFLEKDLYDVYRDFMTEELFKTQAGVQSITEEQKSYFKRYHENSLISNQVELEDLAPLALIRKRLNGFKENLTIGNVVIDEAQDFSTFEIKTLKNLLKTDKFTLLGDLSQGIHSYRSIESWDELIDGVFQDAPATYMELVQSYRTTIEIMDLANKVIDYLDDHDVKKAKPVIRHGVSPRYQCYRSSQEMLRDLLEEINDLQGKGYQSIAIICKDREEGMDLLSRLPKSAKATLLKEDQKKYDVGVTIVPSYLAKGLEFDSVILWNQQSFYERYPIDVKLLYVAITRGMHTLSIFEKEEPRSILYDLFNSQETISA